MSKRSRLQRARPKLDSAQSAPAHRANHSESRPLGNLTAGQKWLLRLSLLFIGPAILLGLTEASLRIMGVGFDPNLFVKTEDGQAYVLNESFLKRFYPGHATGKAHPFRVPVVKSPQTMRIFVLGESAALGTPNPSFSFSRILPLLLSSQFPDARFEVFNAAMRGINSHIILPIARACADLEPDLFLVYMGNNECVGLHAPGPESGFLDRHLGLIRLSHSLKATRTGQLMMSHRTRAAPEQNMDFFRAHRLAVGDPGRELVYQHFQANLEELCQVIQGAGAKAVLSTVPVNLKDFPPLASMHRRALTASDLRQWEQFYQQGVQAEAAQQYELALQSYAQALQWDDQYADLHFRIARCHHALNQPENSRRHFARARDCDALPFRADQRINQSIRDIAAQTPENLIWLADAEAAFSGTNYLRSALQDFPLNPSRASSEGEGAPSLFSSSIEPAPGYELFSDHVHFNFEGDYLLARTLAQSMLPWLIQRFGQPATNSLPTRSEVAEQLAYTDWDELEIKMSMVKLTAHPPFLDQLDHAPRQAAAEAAVKDLAGKFTRQDLQKAMEIYQRALQHAPDDWQIQHNFAMLWYRAGDYAKAAQFLEPEVRLFPDWLSGRLALGGMLAKAGNRQAALVQFQEALRIAPDHGQALKAMEALKAAPR